MRNKIVISTITCALIATPALAFTEPFPGSYRETRDITCPAQYPIKTGEGVMGGGYITTCWTSQAWSLQMAGGDDWTAWLNGTYTPAPTPTPTVTVTAAPVTVERVVERVVSGGTQIIVQEVAAPLADVSTPAKIKKEIKRLKKELNKLERKLKKSMKVNR
jgi:HAMP domain-containing protein